MKRFLVTLLAPLIAWWMSGVLLPGIARWALPRGVSRDYLSVVALGLIPMLTGFIAVEVVAATVPRWRALRIGGPIERAKLRLAALVVTLLAAAVQAYFYASYVTSRPLLFEDPPATIFVALTVFGGTCFLMSLAWLVDRWGLAGGYSVLLAAPALESCWQLAQLRPSETLEPFDIVLVFVVVVGLVGATVWILRRPSRLGVRQPPSGLWPLPIGAEILTRLAWLATLVSLPLALPEAGTAQHQALLLALILLQTFAFGRRFLRIDPLRGPWARVDPTVTESDLAAARRSALRAGFGYVAFMAVPWMVLLKLPFAISGFGLAALVAVTLDVAAEWRARRKEPTLVDVWPIHEVALLGAALSALQKAGIFVFPRAVHRRTLLQLFGPFVPIDLYVPAARAEEAQELLAEALLGAEPAAAKPDPGWFERGLAYKRERNWAEAFRCFDEAADALEDTEGEPALWNLGVAATLLGEWRVARAAWVLYGIAGVDDDSDEPFHLDPEVISRIAPDDLELLKRPTNSK